MTFDENYTKLPKVYKRAGKECYLDPIRNKLIYVTPEETVRQRVIQYLLEIGYPNNMIDVEEHLSHYGVDSRRRADIVINAYTNNSDVFVQLMVIECKAPNVELDNRACNQVFDYADLLGANFVVVTNGYSFLCYHYNSSHNIYERITHFPSYSDLLSNSYHIMNFGKMPPRIQFDKLEEGVQGYPNEIGENTPKNLQICMVNFVECLLDSEYRLPIKKYKLFKIIDDLGVRYTSYGDASGGVFTGLYRSFLVEHKNSTEIVSIGLSAYCTWAKQDILKTSINVAVDNEKSSHHAIQLVIDDNCSFSSNTIHFYHHGRIAIGNIGSGKLDELREFVKKSYPEIISGNKYYLGSLTNDRLWRLDDEEVVKLIENLISYALIRDEYRDYKKSQNKR
ncbi:type I restriction enzyme HsdR N-terminal domain-containing protein [Ruminococcus flavefaciens]|uniref:type I restriction enzyme HsdR N-terminal domain-containing protein n=1 Tax=Ruminococcus flavefaciens TaxID=1265 RepID=UPI0013DB8004|nr:type I restriction enzyme HsdR N-terminal domain-containing protein [Ruminococcus flavefaciens]